MKLIVGGAVAAAAGLLLCASTGMALQNQPELTLDVAKKMAAACEATGHAIRSRENADVADIAADKLFAGFRDGMVPGDS